jgi:hypothetical protein
VIYLPSSTFNIDCICTTTTGLYNEIGYYQELFVLYADWEVPFVHCERKAITISPDSWSCQRLVVTYVFAAKYAQRIGEEPRDKRKMD